MAFTINARAAILQALLAGREYYGIALIDAIRDATGGVISLKQGSVYPTLEKLERDGLAVSREEPNPRPGSRPRRYFRLTAEGKREAREARDGVLALYQLYEAVSRSSRRAPEPERPVREERAPERQERRRVTIERADARSSARTIPIADERRLLPAPRPDATVAQSGTRIARQSDRTEFADVTERERSSVIRRRFATPRFSFRTDASGREFETPIPASFRTRRSDEAVRGSVRHRPLPESEDSARRRGLPVFGRDSARTRLVEARRREALRREELSRRRQEEDEDRMAGEGGRSRRLLGPGSKR